MTLLVPWLALPVLLGLLSLGCGLLIEVAAGRRVPGVLLAPAGLALVVVAAQFAVATDVTAQLAAPLVFAAPTVLSGHATWAGYIKLDDTATWLAMTDRVMDHGRDLSGLAPSTYEVTLHSYLAASYPVGSFLPLGIGHVLLGEDSAWL